ncbi:LppP/LprE family lipoprotein [Nocardia sp. NPDC050712]|uniref:LppP/LprE family lipoprotein n=1 Tax=Nocardia sp. NPDC050712 TaxID=3155518 RepID=UPI0033F5909C
MGIKPLAIVLAAGVVAAVAGCGTDTPPPSAGTTSTSRAASTAPQTGTAANPTASGQPDTESPSAPATSPVASTPAGPPPGSGHGLCFDLNSELANTAFTKVAAAEPGTDWAIPGASEDLIADGCSGVLSYLLMEGTGIHPVTHILFFTGGKYLGTASSEPYAYTHLLGKTRTTVQAQYKWPLPEDALCCPTGGPSTVTFTLNGTTVTAQGQFPPAG